MAVTTTAVTILTVPEERRGPAFGACAKGSGTTGAEGWEYSNRGCCHGPGGGAAGVANVGRNGSVGASAVAGCAGIEPAAANAGGWGSSPGRAGWGSSMSGSSRPLASTGWGVDEHGLVVAPRSSRTLRVR